MLGHAAVGQPVAQFTGAGDALLSSSEEGVDSAEFRNQATLTGNEELLTDVRSALVEG